MSDRKIILLIVMLAMFSGCGERYEHLKNTDNMQETVVETESAVVTETESEYTSETDNFYTEEKTAEETAAETTEVQAEEKNKTIVIDPGHQRYGNNDQEPVGPGASETKAKVTSGTSGKTSGLNEYELNLAVSLKLRDILTERGYAVIMTRETDDVDISNIERAQIANDANADAFVRIHANGSEDTEANGAMTICQTPQNPYNGELYNESRSLAQCILDSMVDETGVRREKLWETDTMSGINWAKVPTVIVEMGYMTNPQEDMRMADEQQQMLIAASIADGIENYFTIGK